MHTSSSSILLPGPALIITYGHTPHKHRPLDRDLVLVGSGRHTDICLVSPEVAEVHCVLMRGPTGWQVRDGGSRIGTRLNGQAVRHAPLGHGDVLQIGTFIFRAHLPAVPGEKAGWTVDEWEEGFSRRQAELDQQTAALQERLRECEQRAAQLQRQAHDLARDRAALEQERAEWQAQRSAQEQDLAARQAAWDEEVDFRRRQCEESCREVERFLTQCTFEALGDPAAEQTRRLDLRRRELAHFAGYLQRCRQRLEAEMERWRQEQQAQPAAGPLPPDSAAAALAQAEARFQEKHAQLTQRLAESERRRQHERACQEAELQSLRLENKELRRLRREPENAEA
jgi:Inner membrane component of T3SS, cytoplasmic domain